MSCLRSKGVTKTLSKKFPVASPQAGSHHPNLLLASRSTCLQGVVAPHRACTKCHETVPFLEMVHFMLCEFPHEEEEEEEAVDAAALTP